jgi:hypothetical protein
MSDESHLILQLITDFFLQSKDFNGILASRLAEQANLDQSRLIPVLEGLLQNGQITIAFNTYQGNPHILRFPPLLLERQLELLRAENFSTFCIYPSPNVLANRQDLPAFAERPFSKRLALGEAQLTPFYFELSVLEPYYRDPRYLFHYEDMGGRISFRDSASGSSDIQARDRILLNSFGIAYDLDRNRVVIVYLRYLADLSPEHQQIWNARVIEGPCAMNSDYAEATLFGNWPQHYSAYQALLTEMAEINRLSGIIDKTLLFRDDFSSGRPSGFHPLLRPTERNFQDFVHLLDKMLSDNLNRDFFRGDIPLEDERDLGDGRVQVIQHGTITLLRNWLSRRYRTSDGEDVSEEISRPFRTIRELRQKPAHSINEDRFDMSLTGRQDTLVIDLVHALQKLRLILMSHPNARGRYQPPDWLDGDKIVMY